MKLTIVAVLLALTFVATEASWYGAWDDGHHDHYGYGTHGISLNHHHHHASHYVAKTLGAVHSAPLPGHIDSVKSLNVAPAPGSGSDHHHAPAHHSHHDHHHASHYVAKTLGAVHSAPLPGHIDSVKSLNVAPAPGSGYDHHHHHHHASAHHAHHDHHHSSHYIAKTLGAVHTAPLPGHIDSVKSLNVAPAPGSGYDHHHHHAPAHHAHHDHHHGSYYVAKTLGAVHSAPLPGHIDSVKSLNVAPAPGSGYDHHHHHAPAYHGYHDHHHHASHYIAKTLGAVHTAPLPGHVDSVKSFNVASAPGSGSDHHHAPAHHAHHDHHHASYYVAKTLGAVHSAPLPGHIDSVKSLNVAPAPGSGYDHHHHHHAPAHHAHHDHHHGSYYVAKTLGAVHSAPLPGHIDSVKSLNVAPAPGSGYDHHHHHAPAYHAYHDHHHHASHYIAKTLGAVHTAPLPGHVDSVKSFNVASAPGTH